MDVLLDEISALEATLMDDVTVTYDGERPVYVSVLIHPSTADNPDEQYVRMTMNFNLPDAYPDESPQVTVSNCRGISEESVQEVLKDGRDKMAAYLGEPVIYMLLETARDHLTQSNRPAVPCVICLYDFTVTDSFTKTDCYHYFHCHCLARYITYFMSIDDEEEQVPVWQQKKVKSLVCPVCREPISNRLTSLLDAPPPELCAVANSCEFSEQLRAAQLQMTQLYTRQLQRGGLIDPDQQQNQLLVVTEPETSSAAGGGTRPRNNGSAGRRSRNRRRNNGSSHVAGDGGSGATSIKPLNKHASDGAATFKQSQVTNGNGFVRSDSLTKQLADVNSDKAVATASESNFNSAEVKSSKPACHNSRRPRAYGSGNRGGRDSRGGATWNSTRQSHSAASARNSVNSACGATAELSGECGGAADGSNSLPRSGPARYSARRHYGGPRHDGDVIPRPQDAAAAGSASSGRGRRRPYRGTTGARVVS